MTFSKKPASAETFGGGDYLINSLYTLKYKRTLQVLRNTEDIFGFRSIL